MPSRLLLATFWLAFFLSGPSLHVSSAQTPENELSPAIESPTPFSETSSAPPTAEPQLPETRPQERADDLVLLGELRNSVLVSPNNTDTRLKLSQALYRIGDLDAALDECRVAIKLDSRNARAYLQLGITLMAKQDGQAASIALMEALQLDPKLTQAHYSLGTVQYSLGNLPAAIQSYRRALDLQPDFPDARYRLALVLKLTNRHQEAVQFMESAAGSGIAQAQYFMGNAYRNGQGVERNLTVAIRWWTKAMEFGQPRAAESLSLLRRQALSPDQPEQRRTDAITAFRQYRRELWGDYPDAGRHNSNESVGVALLKGSQVSDGITALFVEALALGEAAHDELAQLYETGLDTSLAQFDTRILRCFTTTAADGFIPSKKALARIYGKGIGVTQDRQKATAMLKGLSKQEMQEVLDEIAAQ
ncbi:MAG: tetratricopeptide repeat protein [Nitrospiraceae bacterium]|nr:tetratricopeptide repeat protein [Nitrospiraceae bacterium]